MAYEIEFAPKPAEVMKELAPELQHRIIHLLESEASTIEPEPGKSKKLRRIKVEDHRLVLLELHTNQRLMVLKIADPGEVFRRLQGEERAFEAPQKTTPPVETPQPPLHHQETEPQTHTEENEPVLSADHGQGVEPSADTTNEQADMEQGEKQEDESNGSQTGPDTSMSRLKREYIEQVIHKGELFIVPDPDVMEIKRWGVRLAGSGGAFGYRYISEIGQELSQTDVGDIDGLISTVNRVLDFARSELARLAD